MPLHVRLDDRRRTRHVEPGRFRFSSPHLLFIVSLALSFRGRAAAMDEDKQSSKPKWEGSVEVRVAAPLERVWGIASDFYGLLKWYPGLQVCEKVEGDEGCVRYCAGPSFWVKEKLVSMDCTNHSYTYVVVDGNMEGLLGYQATFRVEEEGGAESCVVKWVFQVEPVAGKSEEELVGFLRSALTDMSRSLGQIASS